MTASHEHTPPEDWLHTEWIRSATITGKPIRGNTFDRWLAARDARIEFAAEQRGAERALRDAANDLEYLAAQIDPTLEGAEMYAKAGQEIIQTLRDRAENYHLQHGAADRIADKEGGGNA